MSVHERIAIEMSSGMCSVNEMSHMILNFDYNSGAKLVMKNTVCAMLSFSPKPDSYVHSFALLFGRKKSLHQQRQLAHSTVETRFPSFPTFVSYHALFIYV